MTATDPRPRLPRTPIRGLAATLAERLVPAAEALALAYAEDMNAGPPPEDDRALAERHRAGRAQLGHLRQLLSVLDWAGKHLPEPEQEAQEEPWDGPDNPSDEPDTGGPGYDGSENEFHYRGEVWAGSQETSGFRAWSEDMDRRFGRSRWTGAANAARSTAMPAGGNSSAGCGRPNSEHGATSSTAAPRKPSRAVSTAQERHERNPAA